MAGLPREPKFTHLRNLHRAIKLAEPALVSNNPIVASLGKNQEVFFYISYPEYKTLFVLSCVCKARSFVTVNVLISSSS